MITVSRELYPKDQDESVNVCSCVNSAFPTYTSDAGSSMLEIRRSAETSQMWRSLDGGAAKRGREGGPEDGGETWAFADEIPIESRGPDGLFAETGFGPLYRDPDNDRLIRFQQECLYTVPRCERKTYFESEGTLIENSYRAFYQISHDGGQSWDERRQFIEHGDAYDATHWAKDVTFREGCAVLGEPPPFHKLSDGRIVFPCNIRTNTGADKYGTIQAGRFYGQWNNDGTDLTWTSGGRVYGGGCEQTTAVLRDGRILNIMRVQGHITPYLFDPWLRPWTVSEDGGETWSEPKPLTYDDGSGLTSPRAWTVLIRSDKNGRLYWIANILPAYDSAESADLRQRYPGRADPRYPLAIVEVDEDSLTLKKNTFTVIQDREPHMPHWVRFSNYHVYNDRQTGDLVLLMLTSYCELQEDRAERPWPSYRYRISVDG